MLAVMFSGRHMLPKTDSGEYFIDRHVLCRSELTLEGSYTFYVHYAIFTDGSCGQRPGKCR